MKRILITGSRTWEEEDVIEDALSQAWADLGGDPYTIVVSGACPKGADAICERLALRHGLEVERHPADWKRYEKRAGFIRNAEMVERGAHLCLAFIMNGSKGATMTADLAEKAGIETRRYLG